MWRNNKVLVIDDNSSRSHDLKILLDFLSETTLVTPSDCWQAAVAEENGGEDYVATPRFTNRMTDTRYLIGSDLMKTFKRRTRFGILDLK